MGTALLGKPCNILQSLALHTPGLALYICSPITCHFDTLLCNPMQCKRIQRSAQLNIKHIIRTRPALALIDCSIMPQYCCISPHKGLDPPGAGSLIRLPCSNPRRAKTKYRPYLGLGDEISSFLHYGVTQNFAENCQYLCQYTVMQCGIET